MPMIPLPAPGNRKLWMYAIAAGCLTAIVITWLIVQPEGMSLQTLIAWAGPALGALTGLGQLTNLAEHKIHAPAKQATTKETP